MTTRSSLPSVHRLTMPGDAQRVGTFRGHEAIVVAGAPDAGHLAPLSAGPDYLVGTSSGDTLFGEGGNDTIHGLDGDDSLLGGDGNDQLFGGAGLDTVQGNDGDDLVSLGPDGGHGLGGTGADTVYGGTGNDWLYTEGLEGPDLAGTINFLYGGAGFDQLEGGAGDDRLYGQDGDDTINGYAGADLIDGGNGNDDISGGFGSDTLYGGAGNDTMTGLGSFGVIDTNYLYGGAGNDSLRASFESIGFLDGGADADYLEGGDKADTLIGGTGVDTLEGLAGNDSYYVDTAGDVVIEAFDGGIDLVVSTAPVFTLAGNVENLRLMSALASNGIGNGLDNVIYAGAGNNVINGGAGSDTVSYAFATSAVNVTLALVSAQATGGSGTDTLASIEALFGSNYNDALTGNVHVNTLSGGAGDDTLDGGGGADRLVGGLGADTYYVDTPADVITEALDGGIDTVISSAANVVLAANVEHLRLTGTGNANGTGNALDNTIWASAGDNILDGGAGTDTLSYAYSEVGVAVQLFRHVAQNTAGSGYDIQVNFENLTGSAFHDLLRGDGLVNVIDGGGGDDLVFGGVGADSLIGGGGGDTFFYTFANESTLDSLDTIVDFSQADGDWFDLSPIDADEATSGDQAFTYIGSAAFSADATGQVRYDNGMVYASTDADADAEFVVFVAGAPALVASDFFL